MFLELYACRQTKFKLQSIVIILLLKLLQSPFIVSKPFFICFFLTKTPLKNQASRVRNWSKVLHQINQETMKAWKNNWNSWNAAELICTLLERICWSRSGSCFIYGFVLWDIALQRFYYQFDKQFYIRIM